MWFLYLLSFLWLVGVLGVTFFFPQELSSTMPGKIIAYLICIPMGVFLGVLPLALVIIFDNQQSSPDLATLKKNEWQCAASHNVTNTIMIMSGKVLVPMTTTTTICDIYSRK